MIRLNTAINRIIAMPDIVERFARDAVEATPGTPEQLAKFVAADYEAWRLLIECHAELVALFLRALRRINRRAFGSLSRFIKHFAPPIQYAARVVEESVTIRPTHFERTDT